MTMSYPAPESAAAHRLMRGRRSIRRYRPDAVGRDVLDRLFLSAAAAPSAHNRQPWRYLVLEDATVKAALARAMGERLAADRARDGDPPDAIARDVTRSHARITGAPVLVLVCVTWRRPTSTRTRCALAQSFRWLCRARRWRHRTSCWPPMRKALPPAGCARRCSVPRWCGRALTCRRHGSLRGSSRSALPPTAVATGRASHLPHSCGTQVPQRPIGPFRSRRETTAPLRWPRSNGRRRARRYRAGSDERICGKRRSTRRRSRRRKARRRSRAAPRRAAHRDRQYRRRFQPSRPAHFTGPRHRDVHARRHRQSADRLGHRRRDLEFSRPARTPRRAGVVPPRRPRPRNPRSAHASAWPPGIRIRPSPPRSPARSASPRRCSR